MDFSISHSIFIKVEYIVDNRRCAILANHDRQRYSLIARFPQFLKSLLVKYPYYSSRSTIKQYGCKLSGISG